MTSFAARNWVLATAFVSIFSLPSFLRASELVDLKGNKNWKAGIFLEPHFTSSGRFDGIHVGTLVPSKSFREITRQENSEIEARFYVKMEGEQERALFKEDGKFTTHFYLESSVDQIDLDRELVCPKTGDATLRVWLSVRERSGAKDLPPNNDYKDYEQSIEYSCLGKNENSKSISFAKGEDPEIERFNNDGDRAYRLGVEFNKDQFAAFKKNGSHYVVRLFAARYENTARGKKLVKMQVGRDYEIPASDKDNQANRSYVYPIKDACETAKTFWEEIVGRDIGLSFTINVEKSDGRKDFRYREVSPALAWAACP